MLVGDMRLTPAGSLLIRSTAATGFTVIRSAELVLLRGFFQIAHRAGLDGDELGYLFGRLAQMKVPPRDPMLELGRRRNDR